MMSSGSLQEYVPEAFIITTWFSANAVHDGSEVLGKSMALVCMRQDSASGRCLRIRRLLKERLDRALMGRALIVGEGVVASGFPSITSLMVLPWFAPVGMGSSIPLILSISPRNCKKSIIFEACGPYLFNMHLAFFCTSSKSTQ